MSQGKEGHAWAQFEDKAENQPDPDPLWQQRWFWKLVLWLSFTTVNLIFGIAFVSFAPGKVGARS